MVSSEQFQRLNVIMQAALSNDEPFGGVQLVLLGDPAQLPPVKLFEYCIDCGRKRADGKDDTFTCEVHGEIHIDEQ
jgi:hypothetical protein